MSNVLHSVEHISDDSLGWWNQDFLRLLKTRILGNRIATRLADFGVGEGHWSLSLVDAFGDIAEATGVDPEPEWRRRAASKYLALAPHVALQPVETDANATPLPDNTFDIVTAQTLLLHSATPQKPLGEMIRVARHGGTIICAEPVNHMNWTQIYELTDYCSPGERAAFYGIWMRFVEAVKSSRGDQDIGLRLPTLFSRCGLEHVHAWWNDRADVEPAEGFSLDALEEALSRD